MLCHDRLKFAVSALKTLLAARPYEGMNIRGAIGLSVAQKATFKALEAVEID